MHHMRLKSALDKFKDVTVKEQIVGEYTPEEVNEIWDALTKSSATNSGDPGNGVKKGASHTDPNPEANEAILKELEAKHIENERLANELAELKAKGSQATEMGASTNEKVGRPLQGDRNSSLTIPQFTGRRFEGKDFEAYQEVVRALDQRTLYNWTEFKAVGIWKMREDENGDMVPTNVLIGIELVDTTPLKHTAMQPSHIEYWMTGQRGRKVMGGMNAQIYDKSNNRANARFYILRGAAPEQTV